MKNPKKLWLITLVPLLVVSLGTFSIGCKKGETTTTTQVTVTAVRGDLSEEITAVGTLDYSTVEEVSFDTNGTVADILVSVGDSVKNGDVLAELDKTEWQQNITDLESALALKQQALTQAQLSLTKAQRNVTTCERAVTTAEQNVVEKQYALTQAELAVTKTEISIENAELNVRQLQYTLDSNTGNQWTDENLALAKQNLEITKLSLDDAKRNVETAQRAIIEAQTTVGDAKLNVQDAKTSVTIAEANVTKALQDITDAQTELDNAKTTHPEITAPFDGLITVINTKAGSDVLKGAAIVTIVDPDKFEANVSVGETDISNVKVGGDATISFDAISSIILPGKVSSISPTATTSSGVVSYKVVIDVDSSNLNQPAAGNFQTGNGQSPTGGTLPSGFTPGQMPSGGSPPAGFTPGQMTGGSQTGNASMFGEIELRHGFTATVSIIYQQATNVIYVPTQAVSISDNNTIVKVIQDGVITERTVTTGMTTTKYVEITSGLSENEQVVYNRTITSGTTTTTQQQQQQMFGGGGMGGGMPQGGGAPPMGGGGAP